LVKFTPFLCVSDYVQIKFECLAAPPWCSFDLGIYTIFSQIYHNFINNFSSRHQGGGADTLKFNLHIIRRAKRRAKKGCEFNQKRCGFKILLYIYIGLDSFQNWLPAWNQTLELSWGSSTTMSWQASSGWTVCGYVLVHPGPEWPGICSSIPEDI
jgi:hypothetical protein